MTNKIASEVLKASSIQQMGFCKVIVDGKLFSVKEALDIAIKALEQQPDIPKEKAGEWIKYGTPRDGEQHYQCTNCGWYINFGQWGDVYTKQFKFCPNCKARMVSKCR